MTKAAAPFPVLAGVSFTSNLAYAIVVPVLPFAVERFGASLMIAGLVFGAFSLTQLVAAPVLGRLSDRVGRRPALLVSQAGTVAGFGLLAAAGSWPMLLLSRLVDGATAGNTSVAYAVVLDSQDESRWTTTFAKLGACAGAGMLVGLGTSALLAPHGLAAVGTAALLLASVALGLTLLLLPETRRVASRDQLAFWPQFRAAVIAPGRSALRFCLATTFLIAVAQGGVVVMPAFLARSAGLSETAAVGWSAAIVAGAAVFQITAVPSLLRMLGDRRACATGAAVMLVGMTVLATSSDRDRALVGAGLVLAGVLLAAPAATALLARLGSDLGAGALMGLQQAIVALGQLVGPTAAFAALEVGGAGAFGTVGALVALSAAGCALATRPSASLVPSLVAVSE